MAKANGTLVCLFVVLQCYYKYLVTTYFISKSITNIVAVCRQEFH